MTVVIESGEPADAGGDVAFQAGVASATASQAAEEAEEATATAETAETLAEAALDSASRAENNSWDAKAEVSRLESKVDEGFSRIEALLTAKAGGDSAGNDDGSPPAPERKAEPDPAPQAEPDAEETKPKSYGSKGWFGG